MKIMNINLVLIETDEILNLLGLLKFMLLGLLLTKRTDRLSLSK